MAFKPIRSVEELQAEREAQLNSIKEPYAFVRELRNSELCDLVEQFRTDTAYSSKIEDLVLWYNTRFGLSTAQRQVLEQFLLQVKFDIQ